MVSKHNQESLKIIKRKKKKKHYNKLDPRAWKTVNQRNRISRNKRIKSRKKTQQKDKSLSNWPKINLATSYSEKVNQIMQNHYYSPKLIICDLHRYELWNAKEEVVSRLEECRIRKGGEIKIIHGYQHGQVLKNYFRSELFIKELNKFGYELQMKAPKNPGSTTFVLKS